MSAFFDLNELEKNREEAKVKKQALQNSGIDWKQYKDEKKIIKKKKKNEWLLHE